MKLRTEAEQELVIPIARIRSIRGKSINATIERTVETAKRTKRMTFELGADAAGEDVEVTIFFFAPGLRWIPTYRISGQLVDSAEMALQAEILNEAEDLEDVAVDLVVGVPHFKFKSVVSPLALEAQLQNALQRAAPQLMSQVTASSNSFFRSRAGESVGHPSSDPMDMAPELAAGGTQDLFVYSVPRMTLDKGARATLPLWQATAPLAHVYTLDLALGRQVQGGGSYVRVADSADQGTPLELAKYKVWHQIELANRSEVPWTTGAALTMRESLPIGQDMLGYTPRGGRSLLPLTQAVDVRAGFKEIETSRETNALNFSGRSYARITKRATFTVQNFRGGTTQLRVRLSLGGRVSEASDGGEIRINDFRPDDWWRNGGDARVNNHSDVEWNVEVGAGETLTLTCTYAFFVR